MSIRAFTVLAAVVSVVVAGPAAAQHSSPIQLAEKNEANPSSVATKTAATKTPTMPHVAELMVLLRSTLLAVNQANRTGNYTVLRDLGTPEFQRANNASRLTENFQSMRARNVDIGAIAVINAKLVQEPSIDSNGRLRLRGFFPSRPEQVNFDVSFEMVEDRWQLAALSLNTTPADQPLADPAVVAQPEEVPSAGTAGAKPPSTLPPPPAAPPEESPSKKKAATPATKPVTRSDVKPDKDPDVRNSDIRDDVDRMETGTAPKKVQKPPAQPSFNPFGSF